MAPSRLDYLINPVADGFLFRNWKDCLDLEWKWKNFTRKELACKRSGEFYWHERTFNSLQRTRDVMGPLSVSSAHRDWIHNLKVGGAPKSMHKFIAIDIALKNYDHKKIFITLRRAGFTGFGFYHTFIHVDLGRPRFWFQDDSMLKHWLPIIKNPNNAVDIDL